MQASNAEFIGDIRLLRNKKYLEVIKVKKTLWQDSLSNST